MPLSRACRMERCTYYYDEDRGEQGLVDNYVMAQANGKGIA